MNKARLILILITIAAAGWALNLTGCMNGAGDLRKQIEALNKLVEQKDKIISEVSAENERLSLEITDLTAKLESGGSEKIIYQTRTVVKNVTVTEQIITDPIEGERDGSDMDIMPTYETTYKDSLIEYSITAGADSISLQYCANSYIELTQKKIKPSGLFGFLKRSSVIVTALDKNPNTHLVGENSITIIR